MSAEMLSLALIGLCVLGQGCIIYVAFIGWHDARKYKKEGNYPLTARIACGIMLPQNYERREQPRKQALTTKDSHWLCFYNSWSRVCGASYE